MIKYCGSDYARGVAFLTGLLYLLNLGFDRDRICEALVKNGYDRDAALEHLIGN